MCMLANELIIIKNKINPKYTKTPLFLLQLYVHTHYRHTPKDKKGMLMIKSDNFFVNGGDADIGVGISEERRIVGHKHTHTKHTHTKHTHTKHTHIWDTPNLQEKEK